MSKENIAVKQVEGKEVHAEVLAQSIKAIADGIKKLRNGSLNDKALVLLIQHAIPYNTVSQKDIKAVLAGIENLEATYLKRKPRA